MIYFHKLGRFSTGVNRLSSYYIKKLYDLNIFVEERNGLLFFPRKYDVILSSNTLVSPFALRAKVLLICNNAFRFGSFNLRAKKMGLKFACFEFIKDIYQFLILRCGVTLLVPSHHTRDLVCKHWTSKKLKIPLVLFKQESAVPQFFARLRNQVVKDRAPRVLVYISAFYPYKNHIKLVKQFERLVACGLDFRLVMFGYSFKGYENVVQKFVADRGLLGRVELIVDGDYSALEEIDNFEFVFASTFESNCLVFEEMKRTNIAIYCASSAVAREFLHDRAIFFDIDDQHSLARLMLANANANASAKTDLSAADNDKYNHPTLDELILGELG